jgi:hypothetical protein
MWICRTHNWNDRTSELEKFFVERILQRCDYDESISNKHRTINGYVQVKELIQLCELTYKRGRTVRALATSLEEAKSKVITQNIVNDHLIIKYFQDLKIYIEGFDVSKLQIKRGEINLTELGRLLHKLRIFEVQLESHYYKMLRKELLVINMKEDKHFERSATALSELIDLLLPYLLFHGYSISSISEVLRKWLKNRFHITVKRLLDAFSFSGRDFLFLICFEEKNEDVSDFLTHLTTICKDGKYLAKTDLPNRLVSDNELGGYEVYFQFKLTCIDPQAAIRSIYDRLLKNIVIQKERLSLFSFNNYFQKSFWGYPDKEKTFYEISLQFDPINIEARVSTFRKTVKEIYNQDGKVLADDYLIRMPENEVIRKSLYYYHLALGSKSIENSLSLLWTSIESLLPYRIGESDISAIQYLVAKSLSIGAYARDIHSFGVRFRHLNSVNDYSLGDMETRGFAPLHSQDGLINWFDWLLDEKKVNARFPVIKQYSELLGFAYSKLGRPLANGNLNYFLQRIQASELSMKFQLQRIYLHRNQIVHAGNLVNEYSNLWLHLEWYVGKLLAYTYHSVEVSKMHSSVDSVFRELEADHEYLVSYLSKNKSKRIQETSRIVPLLFKHYWQAF